MPKNKGVIINVYVESKTLNPKQKDDPIKKINGKQISSKNRAFKTRGYDRRAQLLAYTRELRHANEQHTQRPFDSSKRKPKKTRCLLPAQKARVIFSWLDGIKRRWRYEPIITEDYGDVGEEGSCNNQEKMKRKKKRIYSSFCKKLRCLLKISRAWKCKNGGC